MHYETKYIVLKFSVGSDIPIVFGVEDSVFDAVEKIAKLSDQDPTAEELEDLQKWSDGFYCNGSGWRIIKHAYLRVSQDEIDEHRDMVEKALA